MRALLIMVVIGNPVGVMSWVLDQFTENIHEDVCSKAEDSLFALLLSDPETFVMWIVQ